MYKFRDRWRVTWRENGKKRSTTFKDQDKARLFELQLKMGLLHGSQTKVVPTFAEFAAEYVAKHAKLDKSESSIAEDMLMLRLHILPHIGEVRLSNLKKSHLVSLRAMLASKPGRGSKPLSAKRINNVLVLAKRIMNVAVDCELITENKFRYVKPMKSEKPKFNFWTMRERDDFLEKAFLLDPEFTDLVAVACHTGLRKGELAGLERRHLDFERRKIRVEQSFSFRTGKIKPTKNNDSADIPMNDVVYEILAEKESSGRCERVFSFHLFHNVHRRFSNLCLMAGARRLRFHDLRHTFASTLTMAGVAITVIRELMRHKSIEMTMRYAHLAPDHLNGQTDILVSGAHVAHTKDLEAEETGKSLILWRTLRDSNSRPSGSKADFRLSFNQVG